MSSTPKNENPCVHDFVWLRQERKNIGFDRNPTWEVSDLFHCKRCLAYRRVTVEHRTLGRGSDEDCVERLV